MAHSQNLKAINIIAQNSMNTAHLTYLLDRGISAEKAEANYLFSATPKQAKELIGQDISGLAIPYFDINKNVVSHRLRPLKEDWENNQSKDYYLERDGKLPKFLSAIKGNEIDSQRGNKAYFPLQWDWSEIQRKSSIDILITEGELKALASPVPTIGISGVNNIFNKLSIGKETIREFLPELEWDCTEEYRSTYWTGRNVGLVFDSDIVGKWQVQRALLVLAHELKQRGAKPFLILLPTEANGDKNGLDDFLVKHGNDAFFRLCQQFKILSNSKNKLLAWNAEEKTHTLNPLEPIASIKGLMAWSVLKDTVAYREGFGWYEWTGKYWKIVSESKILGWLQDFRYSNEWLSLNDKTVFEDLKGGLSKVEIEWNDPNILGFTNGYLKLDTNEFFPPDKKYFVTSILPFDYSPKAKCPAWLNFLREAVGNDEQKIEYARAWLRWILTPKHDKKYPIEATLWLVGAQGTGKGTFLNIMKNLVGDNNYGVFAPEDITNMNMLFGLADKKLAINDDVSGHIPNIGTYNKICSNEPVNVKHLYHDVFPQRLNTVTVLAMNKPLSFSGNGSEGLKRRLHVLNFNQRPKRVDFDLSEKLETELSGIFSWVWGLSLTETKKLLTWRDNEATAEVYESQLTELLFLRDKFPDGQTHITPSDLYTEFSEWCKANGYGVTNSRNFFDALKRVEGIVRGRTKEGRFYSIPEMENYHDNNFKTLKPLPNIEGDTVTHKTGGDTYPVTHPNPYPERKVTQVTHDQQKFSEKNKNNNPVSKKVLQNIRHCVTPQSQQGFECVTPENDKRHCVTPQSQQGLQPFSLVLTESLMQKLAIFDKDLSSIFDNATSEQNIFDELLKAWQKEIARLKVDKKWSRAKFTEKTGIDDPMNANYEQWLDFIAYLRKLPSPTPPRKSKNFIPKPEAPIVNLSDVLPHLTPGTGKHKRNFVCPCCEKDYLSFNVNKGYKCYNPETNCDTKEIFKGFIQILTENDSTWQTYQKDLEQWQRDMEGKNGKG